MHGDSRTGNGMEKPRDSKEKDRKMRKRVVIIGLRIEDGMGKYNAVKWCSAVKAKSPPIFYLLSLNRNSVSHFK